jgi:pimeloyl-ACP methyl ester carboxylesterase
MKNMQRPFAIVSAIGLLLTACAGPAPAQVAVPAGATAGEMRLEPCAFNVGSHPYLADCGVLVVPENRSRADSRLIALPITRIHASGNSPSEPIVFLDGGPGEERNLRFKPSPALLTHHDVVLIGYRGTDGSSRLECPEIQQAMLGVGGDLLSAASRANLSASRGRCAERLQASGVDLGGYTLVESVADLEAARVGLGDERIDFLARGYGTLVAQGYADAHPERVFRSALIDPVAPGRNMVFEPGTIDALIRRYARLCAADPVCRGRTPDLAATMRRVTRNLPDRWLIFPIDPGKVRVATFLLLKRTGNAATVFDTYIAAENGDPSGFVPLQLLYDLEVPITWTDWGDFYAKSGTDFDPDRDYAAEMDLPGSILGSPFSLLVWGSPLNWPLAPIPSGDRRAKVSDTPTLLVTSSVDPRAPAEYVTSELLPHLSRGQQVIIAEAGHELLEIQPAAMQRLLTSFYDTGIGDDALYTYLPVDLQASPSAPDLAKALVGAGMLCTGVVLGLVWLMIRFVRSRVRRRIR